MDNRKNIFVDHLYNWENMTRKWVSKENWDKTKLPSKWDQNPEPKSSIPETTPSNPDDVEVFGDVESTIEQKFEIRQAQKEAKKNPSPGPSRLFSRSQTDETTNAYADPHIAGELLTELNSDGRKLFEALKAAHEKNDPEKLEKAVLKISEKINDALNEDPRWKALKMFEGKTIQEARLEILKSYFFRSLSAAFVDPEIFAELKQNPELKEYFKKSQEPIEEFLKEKFLPTHSDKSPHIQGQTVITPRERSNDWSELTRK